MTKSLSDIAHAMKDIDFCTLTSRSQDGSIGGRPMSNNGNVEYEGTSWFFTLEDTSIVADVARDSSVGVSYQGKAGIKGLFGAPGMFIHVQGEARLIRDKLRVLTVHGGRDFRLRGRRRRRILIGRRDCFWF